MVIQTLLPVIVRDNGRYKFAIVVTVAGLRSVGDILSEFATSRQGKLIDQPDGGPDIPSSGGNE